MTAEILNISEAKAQLSRLVAQVEEGKEVVIAKAGKPVAKLVAYSQAVDRRVPGALRGRILIHDDFDALPEDIASAFGMNAE